MGNTYLLPGSTLIYAFKSDGLVIQNHMFVSKIKYPSIFILKVVTLSRIASYSSGDLFSWHLQMFCAIVSIPSVYLVSSSTIWVCL